MTPLNVVTHGAGPAMAVIHGGLGLDHTSMRGLDPVGDMAQLVYIDLPGHGQSPPPPDWQAVTHASLVDDLDETRARLGLERWIVLGHSYGSFLALRYALRHPTRVAALVLVGTAPAFDHVADVLAAVAARATPDLAAEFTRVLSTPPATDAEFAAGWRAILPLYFHRWDPRYLEAFAHSRFSAAGQTRGAALLGDYDVTGELGALTLRTLIIGGDDDFITPPTQGARIASIAPRARHVVVPQCGHFPFLEQPAPFLRELRAFLAEP